jgi:ribosome recycling factor
MVSAASVATEDKKVRLRGMRKTAITKIGKEELTKDEENRLKEIVDGQLTDYESQLKDVLKTKENELMQA